MPELPMLRGLPEGVGDRLHLILPEALIAGRPVHVTGRIQRDGSTTRVIAERVEYVSAQLAYLGRPVIIDANAGRADAVKRPVAGRTPQARATQANGPRSCSLAGIFIEK